MKADINRNDKHITNSHNFFQGGRVTDRMLWSITENFEDLCHFPSGSQMHSETGHGTPSGQADYTTAVKGKEKARGGITELLGQSPFQNPNQRHSLRVEHVLFSTFVFEFMSFRPLLCACINPNVLSSSYL